MGSFFFFQNVKSMLIIMNNNNHRSATLLIKHLEQPYLRLKSFPFSPELITLLSKVHNVEVNNTGTVIDTELIQPHWRWQT